MSFMRHVGKIGDRKIAVVFREIPEEPHMCLVVYTEILNAIVHDALMSCIESDIGQNSENLADALNHTFTQDGKLLLQMLHREGLLKKTQTSQVIMTPTPTTQIKLEELNKILNEMQQGEAAVKKLAELDKQAGLQSPGEVARRMRGNQNTPPAQASQGALGDADLAANLRSQAEKMTREAKGLMAEADRLMKEAAAMMPAPVEKPAKKTKTTKAKVAS